MRAASIILTAALVASTAHAGQYDYQPREIPDWLRMSECSSASTKTTVGNVLIGIGVANVLAAVVIGMTSVGTRKGGAEYTLRRNAAIGAGIGAVFWGGIGLGVRSSANTQREDYRCNLN